MLVSQMVLGLVMVEWVQCKLQINLLVESRNSFLVIKILRREALVLVLPYLCLLVFVSVLELVCLLVFEMMFVSVCLSMFLYLLVCMLVFL